MNTFILFSWAFFGQKPNKIPPHLRPLADEDIKELIRDTRRISNEIEEWLHK